MRERVDEGIGEMEFVVEGVGVGEVGTASSTQFWQVRSICMNLGSPFTPFSSISNTYA